MIKVTSTIFLRENEVKLEFIRSSGPGGQNVNKVSTAVQLRFDVKHSPSLSDVVRKRLMEIAGKRITDKGVLIIDARRYRTQSQNRQDALDRLVKLIRKAAEKPKIRKTTKPTPASREQRLKVKRLRSKTKQLRTPVSIPED